MPPVPDPWAVLGLAYTASQAELKARYRQLARKYHPDHNRSPEASARFCEIQAAYDAIGAGAKPPTPRALPQADAFVREVGAYAVERGKEHASDVLRTKLGNKGRVGAAFTRFGVELLEVLSDDARAAIKGPK